MVITRTPYRMSFFGGGTDYPAWYLKEGGSVLSTTIDKYCYLTARILPPFFNLRHRVVWSHIETVLSIREILHPCVRGGLDYLGFDDSIGLEIHHQGDLPARSGMGSSSSFAVGLISALTALRGESLSKSELCRKAIELEQEVLHEHVGSQDQVAAAHGGFNTIHFAQQGDIRVQPLQVQPQRLQQLQGNLMLFYLGSSRHASDIAAQVLASMEDRRKDLKRMQALVGQACELLEGNSDLDEFGHLLHESWMLKRGLSSAIASEQVDQVYSLARECGALGGKLLGAGGTGFMVFYVPAENQAALKGGLRNLLHVPFGFEKEGSSVMYDSHQGHELFRVAPALPGGSL